MRTKPVIMKAEEAVRCIKNGDTIAVGGFVGIGVAEEILTALENRFIETSTPQDLTLIFAAGIGDSKDRGLNHLGYESMLKRVIGGHWGLMPKVQKLAFENKIEAYNFPQGVISHMFRDIAAKRPRTISTIGLHTYVDPRVQGGRMNSVTNEEFVELIEFDNREYLSYRSIPLNIAIIRGTTADVDGNVSFEREALDVEALAIAMAVRNCGGKVIVQVEQVAQKNILKAREIRIPGILVDYIVVGSKKNHQQTFAEDYNPSYSGEIKVPLSAIPPMEMSARKIIARRAAFELSKGDIVNLGIGMPEGVASVATEEGVLQDVILTAEPGVIGGIPAGGLSFGAASNVDVIVSQPCQFDFYDGGGIDITFLGLAQSDQQGNLNVSMFGPKFAGCGGFINISQCARKVVFVGTFTAVGLKVSIRDGSLHIDQEGREQKFLKAVEQITFSGEYARQNKRFVLYITERCVFRLGPKGMELIEIAPGIDIDKHILPHMGFRPIIDNPPKLMEKRIFCDALMNLKTEI